MRTDPAPPFQDRRDAGTQLAQHLTAYKNRQDAVVLGLARGGLPVAQAIAHRLRLPLDVFLVRKLGVPGREELAFGAIAMGVRVLVQEVVARLELPGAVIEWTAAQELSELQRREKLYRGDSAALALEGRTIILVDDGLATGASMRVAILAIRQQHPARIVAAVPVAAESSIGMIKALADEFVCPVVTPLFFGVSAFYEDFAQVSDSQVKEILNAETKRDADSPEVD